MHLVNFVPQE